MTLRMKLMTSALLAAVSPALALAQDEGAAVTGQDKQAVTAASDGSFISLTGEVAEVNGDTFTLDYGSGTIEVEMGDFGWFEESPLEAGAEVTVRGRMDEGFFDTRTIDAAAVHVKGQHTYYYSDPNEADLSEYVGFLANFDGDDEANRDSVMLSGEVVGQSDGEFMLDTGTREIGVDTTGLDGMPDIEVGDRVTVHGRIDEAGFFDDRELEADWIVETTAG